MSGQISKAAALLMLSKIVFIALRSLPVRILDVSRQKSGHLFRAIKQSLLHDAVVRRVIDTRLSSCSHSVALYPEAQIELTLPPFAKCIKCS